MPGRRHDTKGADGTAFVMGRLGVGGNAVTSDEHEVRRLEPVRMADLLRQTPGKWVALHNGEIIEARDTFDQVEDGPEWTAGGA